MFIGEDPIHIEAGADIASLVLMPGDPLRAKYIAENFLEDYKLVTSIRNMYGFTGYYNGKKVTVMGSGMGMPSMSIYAFELFHFFNVQKIMRIGTCGALDPNLKLKDIIVADKIYTESKFGYTYNDYDKNYVISNAKLNEKIVKSAKLNGKEDIIHVGMLATCDAYGPYINYDRLAKRIPKEYHILGEEMEAFALVHIANTMGREATAMATVSDSKFSDEVLPSKDREQSLRDMMKIALDAITMED